MPLFFVPMLGLMGIAIVMARRVADAPSRAPEDVAARLLRWAVGLLTADRAEWGQAMVGELDHIQGRAQRLRFALGCVAASLVLPPWGRSVAGVSVMTALALGGIGLYAGVAAHYQLAGADWVAVGVLAVFAIGVLLGAGALVRRPGVTAAGLLGGLGVALAWLTLSGFSLYDHVAPDIVPWHPWVEAVLVPFGLGVAATLWSRDPLIGKRIVRLAACSAGLALYVYADVAVAVIGAGGPPEDEFPTVQGVVGDRLANNLVLLLFTVMVTATVGWGGAAAATAITRRRPAATPTLPAPMTATAAPQQSGPVLLAAPPQDADPPVARGPRRNVNLLLAAVLTVCALLAVVAWLRL